MSAKSSHKKAPKRKKAFIKPGANYSSSGGVDTSLADDWVNRLQNSGKSFVPPLLKDKIISGIGDYASVFALNSNQWVATSCDGVGTKLLWTLDGLGRVEDLAADLLAMNANDLLCVGARPTLFLDYLALGSRALLETGGLLEGFVKALQQLCFETGQMLVGGETAQMPDLYAGNHFDLAGFSVGFLPPQDYLSVKGIHEGSELWAWPSSGPHSNGYSWLRKLFSTKNDAAFIRDHLMAPTRLYVNEFFGFREKLAKLSFKKPVIEAAFHITGSGWLNLLRAQPEGRSIGYELSDWNAVKEAPLWMREIKARSEATWEELLSSFNGGFGFVMVLDRTFAEGHAKLLTDAGLKKLGRVVSGSSVKIPGLKDLV